MIVMTRHPAALGGDRRHAGIGRATAASFESRQGMTWACSAGSDLAVSLDATCDEEMGAAEDACGH